MDRPWRPEREVGIEQARAAIRRLGVPADDVRLVATGWDNSVLLVDDDLVFRFPRRAIALPGVEREIAVLPALAGRLPLAVPEPRHVGTFGEPAWPFWGGPWLPGTELPRAPWTDVVALATAVGAFLRILHAPHHRSPCPWTRWAAPTPTSAPPRCSPRPGRPDRAVPNRS